MIHISRCGDRYEELVRFVVDLNGEGSHHIGFFGEGEADVRASLAECSIPPAQGFLLATEVDKLAGVFGVDVDPEITRAWLYGPLVVQEFAARHGFPLRSENAILRLDRERYAPAAMRKTKIVPYEEAFFDRFERLHRSLFPNAYFTARHILEKVDNTRQLFIAYENGQLAGYH